MYRVDPASAVPIYRQIVDQITHDVAAGRLGIGDRLPSVRELARALPANQNTVLKAYEHLERDGVIERKQGNGTFVTARRSPLSTETRREVVQTMLEAVVAKAIVLDVPAVEVHALIDQRWAALASRAPADKPSAGEDA